MTFELLIHTAAHIRKFIRLCSSGYITSALSPTGQQLQLLINCKAGRLDDNVQNRNAPHLAHSLSRQ